MSTIGLLLLIAATHYGYEFAPNKWAAFASGLGAMTAILLWERRGPKHSDWVPPRDRKWWRGRARWWLSFVGACEGWQVFIGQGAANWWNGQAPPFEGMFGALTGLPMYGVGLGALAWIAWLVASERDDHG